MTKIWPKDVDGSDVHSFQLLSLKKRAMFSTSLVYLPIAWI